MGENKQIETAMRGFFRNLKELSEARQDGVVKSVLDAIIDGEDMWVVVENKMIEKIASESYKLGFNDALVAESKKHKNNE